MNMNLEATTFRRRRAALFAMKANSSAGLFATLLGSLCYVGSPSVAAAEESGAVSVAASGAKADGVADDTAAIQAALDLAARAGGRVLLSPARYLVGGSLHIPPGVTVQGRSLRTSRASSTASSVLNKRARCPGPLCDMRNCPWDTLAAPRRITATCPAPTGRLDRFPSIRIYEGTCLARVRATALLSDYYPRSAAPRNSLGG